MTKRLKLNRETVALLATNSLHALDRGTTSGGMSVCNTWCGCPITV